MSEHIVSDRLSSMFRTNWNNTLHIFSMTMCASIGADGEKSRWQVAVFFLSGFSADFVADKSLSCLGGNIPAFRCWPDAGTMMATVTDGVPASGRSLMLPCPASPPYDPSDHCDNPCISILNTMHTQCPTRVMVNRCVLTLCMYTYVVQFIQTSALYCSLFYHVHRFIIFIINFVNFYTRPLIKC